MIDDTNIIDAINESLAKKPEQPVRPKPWAANKHNRIRNKILRDIRLRRGNAARKAVRDVRLLRRGGVEPSSALLAEARLAHAPVPRALQGQVKQTARSLNRFQNAQARATKVRSTPKPEVVNETLPQ